LFTSGTTVRNELPRLDHDPHAADDVVLTFVVDVLPPLLREVVGAPRDARGLRAVDLPAREDRADRDRQCKRERERCERRCEQPRPQ